MSGRAAYASRMHWKSVDARSMRGMPLAVYLIAVLLLACAVAILLVAPNPSKGFSGLLTAASMLTMQRAETLRRRRTPRPPPRLSDASLPGRTADLAGAAELTKVGLGRWPPGGATHP